MQEASNMARHVATVKWFIFFNLEKNCINFMHGLATPYMCIAYTVLVINNYKIKHVLITYSRQSV